MDKNQSEKGIKKEKLNWLLRVITLGDRFSLQDFYDRIKKGFVEFLIVFFGVLVSFGVESQGEDFDDRESNIDNLVGLRDEMIDIKEYTQIYIEEKFLGERGRINCSLKVRNNYWRWLGIQFVLADK